MDPGALLAYLKLPTKVLAAVALAALGVLFLPDSWIAATGLADARTKYRWALGLAVWVPVALLIVESIAASAGWAMRRAERRRGERDRLAGEAHAKVLIDESTAKEQERRAAERAARLAAGIKFLENMTDPERAQCEKFISSQERTVWLSAEDGVVAELVRRGVIYPATRMTHFDMRFQGMGADFTITDWARDHLRAHPDLVVLTKPKRTRG